MTLFEALEEKRKPPACFKEVIQKHFFFKKKEIKEQCEQWLRELESHVNDKQIGASMAKNAVALKVKFRNTRKNIL